MARDDDNFESPQGAEDQDFEFSVGDDTGADIDDSDFEIGDSPYGNGDDGFDDNDIVGQIDDMEAFGLTADDDVLGETINQPGDELSQDGIDAFSDDASPDEEYGTSSEWDEEEASEEQMEEDDAPASTGLGWKAWAGLITTAVLFAGVAVVVMAPSKPDRPQPTVQQIQAPTPTPQQQATAQPQVVEQASVAQPKLQAQPINIGMEPSQAVAGESATDIPAQSRVPNSPISDPRAQIAEQDTTATERVMAESFVTKEDFGGLKALVDSQATQLGGLTQAMNRTEVTLTRIDRRLTAIEQRLENEPEKVSKADPDKKRAPDESVKEAQILLTAYNYRPGPIDGLMGKRTIAAIKRFQKYHGLTDNGELNKKTLEAMNGDVKRYAGVTAPSGGKQQGKQRNSNRWYVRGVTTDRAIVYQGNGASYMVSLGTEVPGMGQVVGFDPANNTVKTVNGIIRTQ